MCKNSDAQHALAAEYPKVIDYYLRDGKDRLATAVKDLTAIIAGRLNRERDGGSRPDAR